MNCEICDNIDGHDDFCDPHNFEDPNYCETCSVNLNDYDGIIEYTDKNIEVFFEELSDILNIDNYDPETFVNSVDTFFLQITSDQNFEPYVNFSNMKTANLAQSLSSFVVSKYISNSTINNQKIVIPKYLGWLLHASSKYVGMYPTYCYGAAVLYNWYDNQQSDYTQPTQQFVADYIQNIEISNNILSEINEFHSVETTFYKLHILLEIISADIVQVLVELQKSTEKKQYADIKIYLTSATEIFKEVRKAVSETIKLSKFNWDSTTTPNEFNDFANAVNSSDIEIQVWTGFEYKTIKHLGFSIFQSPNMQQINKILGVNHSAKVCNYVNMMRECMAQYDRNLYSKCNDGFTNNQQNNHSTHWFNDLKTLVESNEDFLGESYNNFLVGYSLINSTYLILIQQMLKKTEKDIYCCALKECVDFTLKIRMERGQQERPKMKQFYHNLCDKNNPNNPNNLEDLKEELHECCTEWEPIDIPNNNFNIGMALCMFAIFSICFALSSGKLNYVTILFNLEKTKLVSLDAFRYIVGSILNYFASVLKLWIIIMIKIMASVAK